MSSLDRAKDRGPGSGRGFREGARLAWTRLRGGGLSPGRAAASVAVGLFVGCTPLYGLHFFIVLGVCLPLRLDVAVAYAAAHVSNPITLPFLLALEMEVGSAALSGHWVPFRVDSLRQLATAAAVPQLVVGALIVGAVLSLSGASTAWAVASRVRDVLSRSLARARKRTIRRYRGAPRDVRFYVNVKLRTDPAFTSIAALGPLGRVVDAGGGFGQLGHALLDLEHAEALLVLDADRARLAHARAASGGGVEFLEARLEDATLPECDTVLFVDSLHYLPHEAQERVLGRAAGALAPGGRIVIREIDARRTLRSAFATWSERRAVKRSSGLETPGFRSALEWAAALTERGLVAEILPHHDWSLFEDVLIVGRKPPGP